MTITKAVTVGLIGSAEGFSADAVKEQLAVRQKTVAVQLERFRREKGIAKGKAVKQ